MSDLEQGHGNSIRLNQMEWELGGLRFHIFFTVGHGVGRGSTGKVFAQVNDEWVELIRFCDFSDESGPHFHAPADAPQTDFDRSLGDPVDWYAEQIRSNLAEWLVKTGFEKVIPSIDVSLTDENARRFHDAMRSCVPDHDQLEDALAIWRKNTGN
jgi:hypothetical protein